MTLPFLLAIVVYHNLYNSTATDVQSTLLTAAVLEDKCSIGLEYYIYNTDILYYTNWYWLKGQDLPQLDYSIRF
jgi:hypothetical protein